MGHVLRVSEPGELVAVIPHLLGFVPHDSVVCLPAGGGGPVARVDHPHEGEDFSAVVEMLTKAYRDRDSGVMLVCVTEDHESAARVHRLMGQALGQRLRVGLRTHADEWVDLATGAGGVVSAESREQIAAEDVFAGRRRRSRPARH